VAFSLVAGAPAAACGDDNNGGTGSPDAGQDVITFDVITTPPAEAAPPDDVNAPETGAGTNLVALHSAFVTTSLRYCFVASATNASPGPTDVIDIAPQPADPGVAPGYTAPLAVPSLAGMNVKVYAFFVDSLQAFNLSQKSCKELMDVSLFVPRSSPSDAGPDAADASADADAGGTDAGGKLLIEGVDFESALNVIPSGTFDAASKHLLFTAGCTRYVTSQFTKNCAAVVPNGDFNVIGYQLDQTAPAAGKNRVQLLHGLIQGKRLGFLVGGSLNYKNQDGGVPIVGPLDGGLVDFLFASGPITPAPGTEVPDLSNLDSVAVGLYTPGGPGPVMTEDLSTVLTVSGLAPSALKSGGSYTFIATGTGSFPATTADGGPNPPAQHIPLLPNE
jgi:hypothetical protein